MPQLPAPESGNAAIDGTIVRCYNDIGAQAAHKANQHFRSVATDEERLHTFHEILFGGYLARNVGPVQYSPSLQGKTPDWVVYKESNPAVIVDACTYRLPGRIVQQVQDSRSKGEIPVYWPEDPQKVWGALDDKAGAYDKLATDLAIPFVVALYGAFEVGLQPEELSDQLIGENRLFEMRPALSGVLFGRQEDGRFCFDFFENKDATHKCMFPQERWHG